MVGIPIALEDVCGPLDEDKKNCSLLNDNAMEVHYEDP